MKFLICLIIPFFLCAGHSEPQEKGPFVATDFSYLLGKSPGFSDSLLELHLTLYKGYVKNTNALGDLIDDMVSRGQDHTIAYGALMRRYGWEYDGMVLHELYFGNMGGDGKLHKKAEIAKKIVATYGSFDKFKQQFKATGLMRGIGWVILVMGPQEDELRTIWVNEHANGHLAGGIPLLVMDVWEHAYITEYGLNRGKYIDAFMENIDWAVVNSRLARKPALLKN